MRSVHHTINRSGVRVCASPRSGVSSGVSRGVALVLGERIARQIGNRTLDLVCADSRLSFPAPVGKNPCRRRGLAGVVEQPSCLVSTACSHRVPHSQTIAKQLSLCQLLLDAWLADLRGLASVLQSASGPSLIAIWWKLGASSCLGLRRGLVCSCAADVGCMSHH